MTTGRKASIALEEVENYEDLKKFYLAIDKAIGELVVDYDEPQDVYVQLIRELKLNEHDEIEVYRYDCCDYAGYHEVNEMLVNDGFCKIDNLDLCISFWEAIANETVNVDDENTLNCIKSQNSSWLDQQLTDDTLQYVYYTEVCLADLIEPAKLQEIVSEIN